MTPSSSSSWTFVGDVGAWERYHVGDEAMLAANMALFRSIAPDATLHIVSGDTTFSAHEYAANALPRLGFDQCNSKQEYEALLAALQPGDAQPQAFRQLATHGDGLVISGGGNLTSAWPAGIYERLAFCRRAVANAAPIIVLGQTIGPSLLPRHRELVSEILRSACWTGVREEQSFALALELGVSPSRLSYQIDDAAFLGDTADAPTLPFTARTPWLGITLHPLVDPHGNDPLLDLLAQQFTAIAAYTGCRLLFIPHAQAAPANGAPWSDEEFGRAIARRMPRDVLHIMPILRAAQVARLTGMAQMVVSSRYHPIVFGLAAGVPCLGICSDEYTKVKLQGVLGHYDRAEDLSSIDQLRHGLLAPRVQALWDTREPVAQRIRALAPVHALDETRRRGQLTRLIAGNAQLETAQPQRLSFLLAKTMRKQAAKLEILERARIRSDARASGLQKKLDGLTTAMAAVSDAKVRYSGQRPMADGIEQHGEYDMLTESDWQTFWRDGFLQLGQVLNEEEVRALQQRADALALGQEINPNIQMQLDTGGDYDALPDVAGQLGEGTHQYRKIQGLETDDLFRPLIHKALFVEICAQMYGRHAGVSLFRAMIMNKPAGQGTHLPWHQDGGTVWELDRDPLVTIWVALDSATTANGCMEAVRGSHRLGLLSLHGSTLSQDAVREHCVAEKIVSLEVPSGHAVLLHNWLIHRSGINPSATPRRAFTMCCMDARTRGLLTGNHYPLIYGNAPEETDHFVHHLQLERAAYLEKANEAERYALSLREHNEALNASSHKTGLDLDDMREENARLRTAAMQLRMETLVLNRALDASTGSANVSDAAGESSASVTDSFASGMLDWQVMPEDVVLLRAHAQNLSQQLQTVYASMSWRITKPLRALLHALHRGRR